MAGRLAPPLPEQPVEELTAPAAGPVDERKRQLLALLLKEKGLDPLRLPIRRLPRDRDEFELSFAQERLWIVQQIDPESAGYNLPTALRFEGGLRREVLAPTLAEIVRRHETLRTTFVEVGGRPVQVVGPPAPVPLPLVDLGALPPAVRTPEARRLAEEAAERPFDLGRGVLRVTMIDLTGPGEPEEHALLFNVHHIASDGWSNGVLVGEVAALYDAFAAGRPSPLPELPVQYVDFAAWQRQVLSGSGLEAALAHWRRQLGEPPPVLPLPVDRARPPVEGTAGAAEYAVLPASLGERLRELARQHGATLFMVGLAAYQAHLSRLTGETDVAVGTPVAGRNRTEVEGLIGFFVNTLVMRTDLGGDPRFGELVARARTVAIEAFAHQELPFGKLVAELNPERSLAHAPLFQVMFALHNAPTAALVDLPSLALRPLGTTARTATFDLTLSLNDTGYGLVTSLDYRTDLFDRATAKRLLAGFGVLLEAVAADPDRRLSALPLLTAAERQAVVVEWNDTAAAYPQGATLHQLIGAQAARAPGAVAVTFEGRPLTYRQLAERAGRLARRLRRLGVGPGVAVGLCVERSLEMMVGLLGVLEAGGAFLPLDPSYPAERLAQMLEDAKPPVVLIQDRLAGILPAGDARVLSLALSETATADGQEEDTAAEAAGAGPDDLAYVLFTSGSTGRPKGAMNSHRAIVNRLLWMQEAFALTPADRVLQKTPFSFDVAVWELFWPLLAGARLVMARPGGHQDPRYLVETIAGEGITTVHFVPSVLHAFLAEPAVGRSAGSLRRVIASGEALPHPLVRRFFDLLPGVELHNLYGPTEAAVDVTWWPCAESDRRPLVPIGRPIANTAIHLVGPLAGGLEAMPLGAAGELAIGGVQPARGYVERPELTAERFVPDPFPGRPGQRLYRTGDLARRLPVGEIDYLGRLDSQVKVRGVRIELGEIEAALGRHPGVEEAAVVVRGGLADDPGDRRLSAFLVPSARRAAPLRRLLRLERQGRLAPGAIHDLPDGTAVAQLNRGETEFLWQEIFAERSYLRHGIALAPGDVVFDVGANIGLFSLFAARTAPGVRIFAFEPLPAVHAALAANVEIHGLDARLFPCGLASAPGRAAFTYYPRLTLVSGRFAEGGEEREVVRSFLLRQAREAGLPAPAADATDELLDESLRVEQVECELKTLSQVIHEESVERIDLLKVDVEKSEAEVLAGLAEEDWPRVRQVVAEVHDLDGRLERIVELLRRHGFVVTVEQERSLASSSLYNLYAHRGLSAPAPAVEPAPPPPAWSSAARLAQDVREALRATLPEAMVPADLLWRDELPLTPSGKVDRRALAASAPTRGPAAAGPRQAPRTPAERRVAAIWSEVLGRPAAELAVDDNFFDLGGHSLLASQVLSRLRDATGVELPLRRLFEAPTVAALAAQIESAGEPAAGEAGPPLAAVRRDGRLALSFAQERLWFLAQMDPASAAYNVPAAVRLSGRLDVAAFAAALGEVGRRHEVLRTTYGADRQGPLQRVGPGPVLGLPVVDLAALPPARREREARRLADAEALAPFDLAAGPVARATLLRLAAEEHALLLTVHHIASDAWSVGILVAELGALYGSFLREPARRPSPLPELPIQYADFAAWQRARLSGEALAVELDYWRAEVAGAAGHLDLPADRPRPPLPSFRGAHRWQSLPPALAAGVRDLGRRSGTTLFMTLLAAFEVELHRATGEAVFLVGSTIANRGRRELEGLIGFFINTLALRADFTADPTFATHLARVRETALGAYAHQDLPFERLVEELAPGRDPSRSPLVQVFLQVQNAPPVAAPAGSVEPGDLAMAPFETAGETAKLDLVVNVSEGAAGEVGLDWLYATDLFDAATIARMAGHLETLLAAVALGEDGQRGLGTAVSALPVLTVAERHQAIVEWGETSAAFGDLGGPALHERFAAHAAVRPDAVALLAGEEQVSYGELAARAARLARRLRALEVRRGDLVGLCLERSPRLVEAVLGTLLAGAAYVPLDPAYPAERVAFVLADTGVSVVVSETAVLERLPKTGAEILVLDTPAALTLDFPSGSPAAVSPDDLAYVIYTSGSTGTPKGVMVRHRDVLRLLAATVPWFDFDASDVWTLFHSYAFDFSVWELWGALAHGGTLAVVPFAVSRSPRDFLALLRRERVTVLNQTPSAFRQLIAADAADALGGEPLDLRLVIFGGEALEPASLSPWVERHGDERPALVNMYGITETTVHVTYRRLRRADLGSPGSAIGRPIPDQTVHLLGAGVQPVPILVPGELYVGGAGLALGYLGRSELTAERFVPDPFSGVPAARLYRSGDLARLLPDGGLDYLGRIDQQVKVRGFRIELGEIEAALARYPDVREAAVVVRDGTAGELTLVACLVLRAGLPADRPLTLVELREHLGRTLPDYMLPGGLVVVDALPLTANGKVDRRALARLEPAAGRAGTVAAVAPRTPLERFLAGLFRETLRIERVGVDDDFFALGGNSIAGAVLINRLQETLGEIVQVVVIFDAPTVAKLAAYLAREHRQAVRRLWGPESLGEVGSETRGDRMVDEALLAELRQVMIPLPPRIPFPPPARAEGMEPEPRNPRALFILAPPRSGTTLLRVMLGGHPELFAPPELELLSFADLAARRDAFTGRDSFWLEGAIRAVMEAGDRDVDQARDFIAQGEREGWSTRRLYRRLQEWIAPRLLVDKTPSYALDSGVLARAEAGFEEPFYIHLVRHPRGMIRSFEEAKLDQLFFRWPHSFSRRELAELVWLASQQNILGFLAEVPAARWRRIHFEELVRDPEGTLRSLCDFLGVPFELAMAQPYERSAGRMTDGLHAASRMLGDVKFHQHAGVDAAVAERWKDEIAVDSLGEPTREMAAALGYEDVRATPRSALALAPFPRDTDAAGEAVPLSFAQERLWFLDRLEPGTPTYNIPSAMRLTGDLDAAALARALGEIVRRHGALRSIFSIEAGAPAQRVAPASTLPPFLPLPAIDLTALPPARREDEALRLAGEEAERPFDLQRGPLLRAALLALAAGEHVALFTLHHIAGDGWSVQVLIAELTALYAAFRAGRPSPLPALPVQYADYAAWQRGWLHGAALEREIAWWAAALDGAPVLDLPVDFPRPPVLSPRGDGRGILLAAPLLRDRLASLAEAGGATLFMALLGLFTALLARLSGQDDVSLGTPVANRTRPEVTGLIGFFVNTLTLRLDLTGDPDIRALLARSRQVSLGAFAHQDLPFERLVAALQPERDRSRSPLFQVLFTLANAGSGGVGGGSGEGLALPGLALAPLAVESRSAKFDLSLTLSESPAGLVAGASFRSELFLPATVQRLLGQLAALVEGAVAAPATRLSALPLLTAAERHQVEVEWGGGWADGAIGGSRPPGLVLARLAARAAVAPAAVAVTWGSQHLTFGELDRLSARLARRLVAEWRRAGGAGPPRVGLLVERSLELPAALLAIWRAGGAYVPLDSSLPAARLAGMAADALAAGAGAGNGILLASPALHERAVALSPPGCPVVSTAGEESPEAGPPERVSLPAPPAAGDPAYLLFTSGSTGTPKGVLVQHGALAHTLAATQPFGLLPGDRMACLSPSSFDVFFFDLLAPLVTGGSVVLVPIRPTLDLAALAAELPGVTALSTVPAVMRQVVALAQRAGREASAALRRIVVGGDAVPADLLADLRQTFPAAQVNVAYGPTEAAIFAAADILGATGLAGPTAVPGLGTTLGRPLARVALLPVDRHGNPAPIGVPGELLIGGPGLAVGYLGHPGLTAAAWIPRATSTSAGPGERNYRTGDLGRWLSDGTLDFLGRIDRQVKVRGFRIELGEIEAALAALPEVAAAVVLPWRGRRGEERLIGYVVPAPGIGRTGLADGLASSLAARLPEYMIPAAWEMLDELPLTPNDKVDRRALAALTAWTGAAGQEGAGEAGDGAATRPESRPGTPMELRVAAAWEEVLGSPPAGTAAGFFAAGGDSIQAALLVNVLQDGLGQPVPVTLLFEHPTLAGLAGALEALSGGEPASLVGAPVAAPGTAASELRIPAAGWAVGEALPLSFAQERLWFIDRMDPGSAVYNVPSALRLAGRLDVPALAAALSEIALRHAALRTTFAVAGGRPVQVVAPPAPVPLPLVDLAALPATVREAAAGRLALAAAERPFDLERGPLLRAALLRLGEAEHVALFDMHHIVSDGWSIGVLTSELAALYGAFSRRLPSPLPELAVQYVDFALWQRGRLGGEGLERQLDFWRRALAGAPVLDLPTDLPRPPVQTSRGSAVARWLPAPLRAELGQLAERAGATLFMTLLAGLAAVLGRLAGQRDVSLGFPIANRTRAELEGLIGFFVNTLVLRTDLHGDPDFPALVGRARQAALAAFAHQDVPFERVVEALQPERDRSRSPLFQVMFAFQNAPSGALELPGIEIAPLAVETHGVKFDLTVSAQEAGDGLLLSAAYRSDLFHGATVARWLAHLERLLAAAVAAPDVVVDELPLLAPAERHQVAAEWQDRPARPTPDAAAGDLSGLLRLQAARRPDAVAVEGAGESLTWAGLDRLTNRLADRLARRLVALEVGPEARVAVCLARTPRWLAALFAVLRSGGVYVPLDPAYPRDRLAFLLADSGTALVLAEEGTWAALPDDLPPVVLLDARETPAELSELVEPTGPAPGEAAAAREPGPDDLAYLIYTSGSTGTPKGVAITHRGLVPLASAVDRELGLTAADRVLQFSSHSFDASILELVMALEPGAALHLAPREALLPGAPLAATLAERGISAVMLPPSALGALGALGAPGSPGSAAGHGLPALRLLAVGGEACPPAWADDWAAGRTLFNVYGPTETTVLATSGRHLAGERPLSLGRPLAGTTAHVLDERLAPAPPGVPGELHLAGAGLARGYLGRPGLTAAAFVPDPLGDVPGGRLYRTGDLVRWLPDGRLEFLGRTDRQVKVRGFRIEPGEVEAALLRHPQVQAVAVEARAERRAAGIEDPSTRRLVAYVVAAGEMPPGIEELRRFLSPLLPEHLIPAVWVFLDALPQTPWGKVDRRALPAPERLRPELEGGYVAPRTALESALAELWREVLGLERVGVEDDFFALGGASLQAALLIHLVEERLGAAIPVAALFEAPTVAALARRVEVAGEGEESEAAVRSPRVALQPQGEGRPLFCVHPVGGNVLCYADLARRLGEDRPFYGLEAVGLTGAEPQRRIEEMAATYLAAVREAQPAGPYLLAGWSLGGLVAFEMARQLAAGGEATDLLVLIDSPPPGRVGPVGTLDETQILAAVGREIDGLGEVAAQALEGERARRLVKVFQANVEAAAAYAPPATARLSTPAAAILYRASERPLAPGADPGEGWRQHLGDAFEVETVAGDHYSLLREPLVEPFAARLRRRLALVSPA